MYNICVFFKKTDMFIQYVTTYLKKKYTTYTTGKFLTVKQFLSCKQFRIVITLLAKLIYVIFRTLTKSS